MKLKKINKELFVGFLENEMWLKIIALLFAVVLFVSVNQLGNPIWKDFFTTTEYVDSVPIRMEYDSDMYVISGVPKVVSATMSGPENSVTTELRRIDTIYGDLKLNSRGPGEYTISSSEISFNTGDNIVMESTVKQFNVKIQKKVEKEMPITINYINGDGLSSGYVLKSPKLSETNVNIVGGNEDVDRIVSVMGFVDLSELSPSETKLSQDFNAILVAYDSKGSVVTNVNLDPNQIVVTQDYDLNSIEVPVTYEYVNNDTGKYVSSICDVALANNCNKNQTTTVKVYGDSSKINNLDAITYKINLANFIGTKGEVPGTPILDSGVFVLGEYDKKYTIELETGIERKIENVPFQVSNLIPTLQAKTAPGESATVTVTVTGAKSIVENLTESDIILSLDLSGIDKPTKNSFPIRVKTMEDYSFKLSKDRMNIEIWEA